MIRQFIKLYWVYKWLFKSSNNKKKNVYYNNLNNEVENIIRYQYFDLLIEIPRDITTTLGELRV